LSFRAAGALAGERQVLVAGDVLVGERPGGSCREDGRGGNPEEVLQLSVALLADRDA
jgi:hypothetical protein